MRVAPELAGVIVMPIPATSSASVWARLAELKSLIPVEGSPVQFVRVPLVGVPNRGVTSVGLVLSTVLPEPVEAVTPVPPLATASVPVIDVACKFADDIC